MRLCLSLRIQNNIIDKAFQKKNLTLLRFPPFIVFIIFYMTTSCQQQKTITWRLDNFIEIDGISSIIIGDPQLEKEQSFSSLIFNGINEGLIIPVNPIADFKKFTIEVLFNPSSEGSPEQRFVHFQNKKGNRGLIEIRIDQAREWCLDTYLHHGEMNNGNTLID